MSSLQTGAGSDFGRQGPLGVGLSRGAIRGSWGLGSRWKQVDVGLITRASMTHP
jgi:hypothetical protein